LDQSFLAFLGVAIVVVVTPGPDMLLVMRNTLVGGRAAGTATVAGVITGILLWGGLAAVGVAAILAASAVAFTLLKLAGAAYLVYLGVMAFRSARDLDGPLSPPPGSVRRAAGQGLLSAALNPKLGVFFVTLLPQFTQPAAGIGDSLRLALVFALVGVVWLVVFTQLVAWSGEILAGARMRRRMAQASGVVLIGLGLRVATDR
jgi:threonine/homoserine/homoserine lactone efflux protein